MAQEDIENEDRGHDEDSGPYTYWPAGERDACPDCRGTGEILLLVSTVPCNACGGSGLAGEAAGAVWTFVCEFDPAGPGEVLRSRRWRRG